MKKHVNRLLSQRRYSEATNAYNIIPLSDPEVSDRCLMLNGIAHVLLRISTETQRIKCFKNVYRYPEMTLLLSDYSEIKHNFIEIFFLIKSKKLPTEE